MAIYGHSWPLKLPDWARETGISCKTAWRLFKTGRLPVPAQQLATGTILVNELPTATDQVAIYARVSSNDGKKIWRANCRDSGTIRLPIASMWLNSFQNLVVS